MRKAFNSWLEFRHYCETHAWVYYQAPLDSYPCVTSVCLIYKNGKVRLDYHGNRFTVNEGHLNRLSRPE